MGILAVILRKRFAWEGKDAPASFLAEAVTDIAILTAKASATPALGDGSSDVVIDVLDGNEDS